MYFEDKTNLRKDFQKHLIENLYANQELKFLLLEIFVYGPAYIVGGFLRDFINNKPSRDVDILVDLENEELHKIIKKSKIKHTINRHNGIKLQLTDLEVDMWSIENNWAFREKLVKLNENDKIKSIAKGCFYNFDSLVINLHNFNYSISNYNSFILNNELDILQKSPEYKILNPTVNANILRAFYLRKVFGCTYSTNVKHYLLKKIGELKDSNADYLNPLLETRDMYSKYKNTLTIDDLTVCINELHADNSIDKQYLLEF